MIDGTAPPSCAISCRVSEDLAIVMDINMQRAGFTSRSGYVKYLLRKEAVRGANEDLAALITRIPEDKHDDFDSALLMVTEAPEEKRPSLLAVIGKALGTMLNPKTRRDLGWKSIAASMAKAA